MRRIGTLISDHLDAVVEEALILAQRAWGQVFVARLGVKREFQRVLDWATAERERNPLIAGSAAEVLLGKPLVDINLVMLTDATIAVIAWAGDGRFTIGLNQVEDWLVDRTVTDTVKEAFSRTELGFRSGWSRLPSHF